MNRNVARRGVRVERIFLVSGPMHTLPDHEQEIIRRQAQVSDGPLQVRVRITSAEEVFNFERSGQAVAFIAFDARDLKGPQALQRKIGRYLCLNFISRGQEKVHYGKPVIERQIRKIRIWDPARGESFFEKFTREAEEFERLWDLPTSQKASDYIKRSGGISLDSLLANFQSAQPTGV